MKRSFFVNLIFLITINLLVKPLYIFGIDRVVQNRVGAEEFGLYIALFNFTFLFQIINDFGIPIFNNRNISQQNNLIEKYLPNILALKFILSILFTAVVLVIGIFTGYTFEHTTILLLFIFNQIMISMTLYLRSNISALGFYKTDSLLSILDRCLLIVLVGYLLWFYSGAGRFEIIWFVYAQSLTLFITFLLALILVFSKLNNFKIDIQKSFIISILKQSWPYATAVFLMTLYTYIDVVMIEQLLNDGKYQAGAYGAGYRLLNALNMIGYLFTILLLPMFSKLLVDKKDEAVSLAYFGLKLILAGAIPISIACFIFREPIMILLYDESTTYWSDLMGILMLTFISMSITYIFSSLLTANDSLKEMNKILFAGFILNFSMNLILIPTYKAYGAALSTLVCQFFIAIALFILAHKKMNFSVKSYVLSKILVFAFVSGLFCVVFFQLDYFEWQWNFILSIISCICLALALNLINFKQLFDLVLSREK